MTTTNGALAVGRGAKRLEHCGGAPNPDRGPVVHGGPVGPGAIGEPRNGVPGW